MTCAASGVVVLYLSRSDDFLRTHEGTTLTAIADTIARLKNYRFAGRWDESHRCYRRAFFVPDETLVAPEARRLGIGSVDDLFGGVVPHAFVRTKAITHGLVSDDAERPQGWSDVFAARIRNVVLPGYTAFSARDAERAASLLLADGSVRIKRPLAGGGRGRWRSGAFEASWRVGGATGAELAALAVFMEDATIGVVHASSVQEF